ncbi:hypothetical protein HMPREF0495_02686, partial [Levilactobacillus brevis ATCC 14869 = DSM 20054]
DHEFESRTDRLSKSSLGKAFLFDKILLLPKRNWFQVIETSSFLVSLL